MGRRYNCEKFIESCGSECGREILWPITSGSRSSGIMTDYLPTYFLRLAYSMLSISWMRSRRAWSRSSFVYL